MDENINPTPEELEAEKAALEETKEDEIRKKVISDFGFDEIDDADKIEKVFQAEMKHRKELSQAIGQKRKYRDLAVKPKEETPKPDELEKKLAERDANLLEQISLENMSYPDDIKNEIKKLAKSQGISVKQAAQDPYIQFKLNEVNKSKAEEEASAHRTHKTGSKLEDDLENPPDVDLSTEEGRKKWDDWKAEVAKKHPPTAF